MPIQAGTITSVETITTSTGTNISFSISDNGYEKKAFIYMSDKYRVRKVGASMNAAKLRRMRVVIDKVLEGID